MEEYFGVVVGEGYGEGHSATFFMDLASRGVRVGGDDLVVDGFEAFREVIGKEVRDIGIGHDSSVSSVLFDFGQE